jgi:hypothetical protein
MNGPQRCLDALAARLTAVGHREKLVDQLAGTMYPSNAPSASFASAARISLLELRCAALAVGIASTPNR